MRGIQINFADNRMEMEAPDDLHICNLINESRGIDCRRQVTRRKLEGSLDGENYFPIEDKWEAESDLAHDFIVREEGIKVRFLQLTVREVPYKVVPSISGIRVFGKGTGDIPKKLQR